MATTHSAAALSRPLLRAAVVCLAAWLLLPSTDAAAQGGRARLSADLAERLRGGDVVGGSVIVSGPEARIRALAARHGLRIRRRLETGAVVDVPAGRLAALADDPEVDALSGNHRVRAQMGVTLAATGADQAQAGLLPGIEAVSGLGVGVAVVDSGVANRRELDGRLVAHVDFTDPVGRARDLHGHGTHVAGIIAAAGGAGGTRGMAPGAHLVSLKVLDDRGEGDAASVVAAIDWAVRHRHEYRLRIINLSLGGIPQQPWRDDPICQAIERAYSSGVFVVASAGNYGKTADGREVFGGITVPGTCPHAFTVGALDTSGTAFHEDDRVAPYSSRAWTRFDRLIKPDIVAPGNRIRGLLAPGSTLAREHPELVIGSAGGADLELSGTSMAAAVVSGAVALLLDAEPRLSAVDVRLRIQEASSAVPGAGILQAGGSLNVADAVSTIERSANDPLTLCVARNCAFPPDLTTDGIVWSHGPVWSDGIAWSDGIVWSD